MMKRTLIITAVLILIALMVGMTVMAKKKAPKSQLKSFSYIRGGGMDIESNDEASLWQHPDGKLTLTLRGTCPFETVTFEVGEEVLQRCDSIIKATKLYQSKGEYKRMMVVLDAPSTSFSASYSNSREDFSGSGDMPTEIWEGMGAVVDYLKSLRNGREAIGHMNTDDYLESTEPIKGTEWVDGELSYLPEDDVEELPRFQSKRYGFDYVPEEWEMWLAEGSGQRCIVVYNRNNNIFDVLSDKATLGVKIEGRENVAGRWPQTAQRVITKSEIENLPTDSLYLMAEEIYARHGRMSSLRLSEELRADLKAQPWYSDRSLQFEDTSLTDVEDQNFSLIHTLISRREQEKG